MTSSWILLALLGMSVVSALVPVVNAEALVLAAAAAVGTDLAVAVAVAAAAGQMAGKGLLYAGGRGLSGTVSARSPRAAALAERFHGRPRALLLVCLASAVVGLPPFYAMTVVAGLVGLHAAAFLAVGLLGRFVRFYALAAAPALLA
jgi:membrane protein YqaA with SNARE-associated domain